MRLIAAMLAFLALVAGGGIAVAHGPDGHGGKRDGAVVAETPVGPSEGELAKESDGKAVAPTPPHVAAPSEPAAAAIGDALRAVHPASVHFPIAFFLLAGLLEAFAMARGRAPLFATVDILVVAGALGAVLAALLGWLHTGPWLGGDLAMQSHRWTGTGIAVAGLAALIAVRRQERRILRILLGGLCIALLVQGYWGGELAHGPNHLGAH